MFFLGAGISPWLDCHHCGLAPGSALQHPKKSPLMLENIDRLHCGSYPL
jgi:hypothetical protein